MLLRTSKEDQGDGKEETTKNTRGGPRQWLRKGNQEHRKRTIATTMARRNTNMNKRGRP
jgi:hypothetical protein